MLDEGLAIVAGKVHRRYPPYDPILFRGKIDAWEPVPDEDWEGGGLIEVDSTGFGCVLIDMEVFKKIDKPWFKWTRENGTVIGEDAYFYRAAKQAGLKVFVDCDVKIGHIASMVITEESYFAHKFSKSL